MSNSPNPLSTELPWDLVSVAYAREIAPQFELYARDALRLAGVERGARILDVACGPGTLALVAAPEAARVTAVDFSPQMVARLRERIADSKATNVDVRLGDGQSLELADASFDAAFSMFGLIFFPDRGRGLRELRRVLVPGGRAAIASWTPLTDVPLFAAVFKVLGEQLPQLPMGDPSPPLGTHEAIVAELSEAGFRDVATHRVSHAMPFPSPQAFGASLRRTLAPLVLLEHKLGKEAFEPIAAAIDARLTELAAPGPGSVTMTALIGIGTA